MTTSNIIGYIGCASCIIGIIIIIIRMIMDCNSYNHIDVPNVPKPKNKIMKQTIEIEVPEDKVAVWEDGKLVFKDKPLPKTWAEYAKKMDKTGDEHYIDSDGTIVRAYLINKPAMPCNVLPSERAAEAHLALMQLHQLRDCYRCGWVPNWSAADDKWVIGYFSGNIVVNKSKFSNCFLSFKTEAVADEFLQNFRYLIEEAGDLIL